MQPIEHEIEITKLVGVMAAGYPNTQVSDATIKVYVSMLKDIPLNLLTPAIQQSMAEGEFIPTIARIREKAIAISRPQHISSLEAWGVVKQAMREVGFYRSPRFDDPLIARAVDCIGWQTLCSSENEPADRAHFAKVFESLVRREEDDARTVPEVRLVQERIKGFIADRSMPNGNGGEDAR